MQARESKTQENCCPRQTEQSHPVDDAAYARLNLDSFSFPTVDMDTDDIAVGLVALLVVCVLGIALRACMQRKLRRRGVRHRRRPSNQIQLTNQDDDIWNISSRVNQQGHGPVQSQPGNWPTHDHRLSVSDFVLVPEYTHKLNKPPPPPYSEVDLPSYEQATGCPVPRTDLPSVHQSRGAGPSH